MQNKILKTLIFLGLLPIIGIMSCSKKIDDAYANPNADVVQPIESILPGVIGGFTQGGKYLFSAIINIATHFQVP